MSRFIIFIIGVFFLAAIAAAAPPLQQSKKHKPQKKEQPVKVSANYGKYNVTLKSLDGKIVRLSDYAGTVLLVNLWAPWCTPCTIETPGLVRLYERYHGKGFNILGIAVQTNESDVRAFMERYQVRWQTAINDSIPKIYGSFGIPNSYLFNTDGSLIKEFIGFSDEDALNTLLQSALKPNRK
jgi:thioredoxin-like negative regulator of GroEL